jgi:DNA-binding LacI/PurR family transcriptional regulator
MNMNTQLLEDKDISGPELVKSYILESFEVGSKLPSDDELSEKLGTSRYAATRALTELSAEGLVIRKPRSGSFLASTDRRNSDLETDNSRIAFIASEFDSFLTSELLRGIESQCREKDTAVSLLNSDYSLEQESSNIKKVLTEDYSGAVIRVGEHHESIDLVDRLVPDGYPLVFVDKSDDDLNFPCVKMNQFKAAYEGVRFLIDHGHKDIAFMGYDNFNGCRFVEICRREDGYRAAMEEAGLEMPEGYLQRTKIFALNERPTETYFYMLGYEPMNRMLLQKKRPTAVFFLNFFMSIGAMRAIKDHGLKVPDDISLMCIDDEPVGRYMTPPMTVVAQPLREIGQKAVEVLDLMVEGKRPDTLSYKLDGRIIERGSVRYI